MITPRARYLPIAVLAAALAMSVTSCGGTDKSADVVATVRGVGTITKAGVQHWARVEAVLVHELVPKSAPPKGLIPDPPEYKACVAYLGKTLPGGSSGSSTATLKLDCRRHEADLEQTTLSKLIAWNWTIGRGEALGLRVTAAQERARLAEVVKNDTAYGSNLQRYLTLSGETLADILLRSRVQLFEVRLQAKAAKLLSALPPNLTETQRTAAVARLAAQFERPTLWTSRTTCKHGFVVPGCKEYSGTERPSGEA